MKYNNWKWIISGYNKSQDDTMVKSYSLVWDEGTRKLQYIIYSVGYFVLTTATLYSTYMNSKSIEQKSLYAVFCQCYQPKPKSKLAEKEIIIYCATIIIRQGRKWINYLSCIINVIIGLRWWYTFKLDCFNETLRQFR